MDEENAVPRCWIIIEKVIANCRRLMLYGPPGTGKTFIANAAAGNRPLFAVTLTDEMPAAELRGFFVPHEGRFRWQDGPGVLAWLSPGLLVLNEIDKASGDALSFILALLDDEESAAMTLPDGRTVRPKPGFAVIATSNASPDALPEALRDRFPVAVHVNAVSPAAIGRLSADLRVMAAKIAVDKTEARRIGLRSFVEYDRLRKELNDEQIAAEAVFGPRATDVLNGLIAGKQAG